MFGSIKITIKTSLILTFLFLSTMNAQDHKKQNLTELSYPEVSLISTEKRMLYSKNRRVKNEAKDSIFSMLYYLTGCNYLWMHK